MLNEILAMSLGQLVLIGLKLSLAFAIIAGLYSVIGLLLFCMVWKILNTFK